MKTGRKYRITIEDETRLENIASRSFSFPSLALTIAGGAILFMILGAVIMAVTPLREMIPGYFRDSQRAVTENALLRIDSLRDAYLRNEIFLANVNNILDTDRRPSDSVSLAGRSISLPADSLMRRSAEEAGFIKVMQEREKFNISVIASVAAEGMLMYPVSDEGTVTNDSRDSYEVRIVLPERASVMAIADGAVIGTYYDSKNRSYVVLTQHDNGFVSRISGLGRLLVGINDPVTGGEIIAEAPAYKSSRPAMAGISLWHNGTPVKPYEYILGNRNRIPAAGENGKSSGKISRSSRRTEMETDTNRYNPPMAK